LLVEQLTGRVRFRESVEWLVAQGADDFIDLGPGRVVGGIARATVARLPEVADG
jgi:[acyl-carrier-protein] S-malonyltransferase